MALLSQSNYPDQVASLAVKALLYEVSATPKPGLVDRMNSGAHSDMDFYTFVDSAMALLPYFREITARGMNFEGPAEELLASLRHLGQQAERTMFAATGGVNTHKGLIFSLGVLSASAGFLFVRPLAQDAGALLECCGRVSGSVLGDFLTLDDPTHGTDAYRKFGVTGIRGEAAAGFPNVRLYGYGVLRRMAEEGCSLNDAGVIALLHLMAHVEDTNIIARGGQSALEELQAELRAKLSSDATPEQLVAYAGELDRELIRQRISPGGCADLLAISYLLYFLFDAQE